MQNNYKLDSTKSATVRISPMAWLKIQTLVIGYDKEVAWYSTVEKLGEAEYRVKDVLVYPQIASGAFVEDAFINGDSSKMEEWSDSLTDEQFNEKRGQGHSHVNMSVIPSSTDKKFWETFAMSVSKSENPYVVTMIINKKLEMMWWACDWKDNAEYKNDQINVLVEVEEGVSNIDFFAASKELVKDRVSKPSTYYLFGGNEKAQSTKGSFIFAEKREYNGQDIVKNENVNYNDDKPDNALEVVDTGKSYLIGRLVGLYVQELYTLTCWCEEDYSRYIAYMDIYGNCFVVDLTISSSEYISPDSLASTLADIYKEGEHIDLLELVDSQGEFITIPDDIQEIKALFETDVIDYEVIKRDDGLVYLSVLMDDINMNDLDDEEEDDEYK